MEHINLRQIEQMSVADMEHQISCAINNIRSNSCRGTDDIIRLLRVKRCLLLADPSKEGKEALDDLLLGAMKEATRLKDDHEQIFKQLLAVVSGWEDPEERKFENEQTPASFAGLNHLSPYLRGFNTPAKAHQNTTRSIVEKDPIAEGSLDHLPPFLGRFNTPAKANQNVGALAKIHQATAGNTFTMHATRLHGVSKKTTANMHVGTARVASETSGLLGTFSTPIRSPISNHSPPSGKLVKPVPLVAVVSHLDSQGCLLWKSRESTLGSTSPVDEEAGSLSFLPDHRRPIFRQRRYSTEHVNEKPHPTDSDSHSLPSSSVSPLSPLPPLFPDGRLICRGGTRLSPRERARYHSTSSTSPNSTSPSAAESDLKYSTAEKAEDHSTPKDDDASNGDDENDSVFTPSSSSEFNNFLFLDRDGGRGSPCPSVASSDF